MNKDSFKRYVKYVNIIHKKEVRKNVSIVGVALLISVLIVATIIVSFSSKLNTVHIEFNSRMEQAMNVREQQLQLLQAGISQDNIRRWNIISVDKLIEYTQRNMSRTVRLKQEPRHRIATWIVDESNRHDLDITLVASVISQESRFNQNAISHMEAHGLMQVIDETGRWLSKELGLVYTDKLRLDPKISIKMGTWYLRYLINKYDGNERRALGHYNGGSYQSRAVVLKPLYINHPEYKRPRDEINDEFKLLRDRINKGESLNKDEISRYRLIDEIRCAQNLVSETENYVHEILSRREKFRDIIKNSGVYGLSTEETH